MPRFYLHICDGSGFAEDEEGIELPGLDAAREKAIEGLRDIMAGQLRKGEVDLGSFIEIEDDEHRLVMTIQSKDAIRLRAADEARADNRRGKP